MTGVSGERRDGCVGVNWRGASALLVAIPGRDGRGRPMSRLVKGSGMGTVNGRSGGNSLRSVGLALRGRGPRVSGRKLRGTNVGGG